MLSSKPDPRFALSYTIRSGSLVVRMVVNTVYIDSVVVNHRYQLTDHSIGSLSVI